jgi:hypothetical protein
VPQPRWPTGKAGAPASVFETIDEQNDLIAERRANDDPVLREGQRHAPGGHGD